jgi:ABC-2 type transport system ATP-binding protein
MAGFMTYLKPECFTLPVCFINHRVFLMSIIVNNLSKVYGAQKAVNNISFSIQKGEIAGFLGPNGAGKSTTMKMITGYLPPDAGTALVCDTDVAKDPLSVKRKIGYLPEANPLYADMYVREYLEFIAGIHGMHNKKQKVNDVIDLTGLTVESKKKISQLSKGYKQRTGLAAALIHDPEVLILDEPTEPIEAEWLKNMASATKITGVDGLSWQVEGQNVNYLKKQLLEISLQHNLNIVSLQTAGGSLEEIFRELTQGK